MRRVAALLGVFVFGGCDSEGVAGEAREGEELTVPMALGEPAVFPEAPLVASGRLELESSPISPWCGAVLVAPEVAVTARRCVAGQFPEALSVAFGDPSMGASAPGAAVVDVIVDREAGEDGLAVLVLEQPVVAIEPARLRTGTFDAAMCGASAVSHEYVAKHEDDPGARWLVTGCLEDDVLAGLDDTPNCHGEQGSGVFVGGELVGITLGIGETFDGRGCAAALAVARADAHEAFFADAMELSAG